MPRISVFSDTQKDRFSLAWTANSFRTHTHKHKHTSTVPTSAVAVAAVRMPLPPALFVADPTAMTSLAVFMLPTHARVPSEVVHLAAYLCMCMRPRAQPSLFDPRCTRFLVAQRASSEIQKFMHKRALQLLRTIRNEHGSVRRRETKCSLAETIV